MKFPSNEEFTKQNTMSHKFLNIFGNDLVTDVY